MRANNGLFDFHWLLLFSKSPRHNYNQQLHKFLQGQSMSILERVWVELLSFPSLSLSKGSLLISSLLSSFQ